MKHKQIREILEKHFSSLENVKKYKNYSVVNEGFPGNFNLSFSEPEMLEQFGGLIDIKHRLYYTKIQLCIRMEDFLKILVPLSKKSNHYLGLFDMGGICLCSPDSTKLKNQTETLIEKTWGFLINKLHLNPHNIFIKCFGGGSIKQVIKDKYKINKKIEKEKDDETNTTTKTKVTNKGICGDNYCTIEEANSNSCPQDCTNRSCGDGICDEMETQELCPQDCS